MTTEICEGTSFPSDKTDTLGVDAQTLFAQSLQAYQVRKHGLAYEGLQEVARLARINGNPNLAGRATTLLGLISLEIGNQEGALHWLRAALRDIPTPDSFPWQSLLITLVNVATARLAAEQAQRTIVETQARLAEEIHLLESEVEMKVVQLWSALTEAAGEAELGLLVSRTPDLHSGPEVPAVVMRLLGRFHAQLRDGTPLALCSNRKGRALFMLLVSQPSRRFHRESLLDLLWRGEDPATSTGKLHIAVSRLRRALVQAGLGDDPLVLDQEHYALNERLEVVSDLAQFQAHAMAGWEWESRGEVEQAMRAYEAARTLYQGGYLEDIVGEDWPLTLRAQSEATLLRVLDRLSNWHLESERYAECANCCCQLLQTDDLREDIYRRLMRCLSRSGQRNQALRLYQDLERLLDTELGVEPMRATRRLFAQIRDEDDP